MALDYILRVTGDCQNTGEGAVYIEPIGGVAPYDINWIFPVYPTDIAVLSKTKTGLSVGTYEVRITDASTNINEEIIFLFTIGESFCISIESKNTTCHQNNGALSVSAFTTTNNVLFNLYTLDGTLVDSQQTNMGNYVFQPLSPNTYYVVAIDEGGCTAKTQTCTIKDSIDFDFDLYVVNNSECFSPTGRVYVINQTTSGPFTYLWSNNEFTPYITGLTSGVYSVTVTDKDGCSKIKAATVNTVPAPKFILTETVDPGCNQLNGQITFYLTGGSQPIKYILSNGSSQIPYDDKVTFNGLGAGLYTVTAIDAGKCSATTTVNLTSPDSFQVSDIIATPSICNSNNGTIIIKIQGGSPPYSVHLYFNNVLYQTQSTTNSQIIFSNLANGSYYITISTQSGCFFEDNLYLVSEDKFTLSTDFIDTTCGENNGYISLTISDGGVAPYIYQVGSQIKTSTLLTQSFFELSPGIYNVSVTDNDGCTQSSTILIKSSEPVEFTLIDGTCLKGDDATILLLISSGQPPFTIEWSLNVGPQTGIYVTGLTAGDYFAVVTDANGCKVKKTTKIFCGQIKSNYKTFTICDDIFTQTPNTKFGISQIYAQGFQDLTVGQYGCTLNSATFYLQINIGSNTYSSNLGTFTSLSEYPTDQELIDAIENILYSVTGIGSVVIDPITNYISISTDCDKTLSADTVSINLNIEYDICCIVTTTTTCNGCRHYIIENYNSEFVFTDCEEKFVNFQAGDFENPEFCAKSNQNIIFSTGTGAKLKDIGCCKCNNKMIQLIYNDAIDCQNFNTAQPGQLNLLYYISGYTYPLNIGDFIYNDLCLTESADSGDYRDYNNSIIYHYNKLNGIYQVDYC